MKRLEVANISIAILDDGTMRVVQTNDEAADAIERGFSIYSPRDMYYFVQLPPHERIVLHDMKRRFGGTIRWTEHTAELVKDLLEAKAERQPAPPAFIEETILRELASTHPRWRLPQIIAESFSVSEAMVRDQFETMLSDGLVERTGSDADLKVYRLTKKGIQSAQTLKSTESLWFGNNVGACPGNQWQPARQRRRKPMTSKDDFVAARQSIGDF